MTDELLTSAEHDAVAMTAELWNLLTGIVGDGPARDGDLKELVFHIHAIQRAVLKQAAARAYPDLYRLLGGHPGGSPESMTQIGDVSSLPGRPTHDHDCGVHTCWRPVCCTPRRPDCNPETS